MQLSRLAALGAVSLLALGVVAVFADDLPAVDPAIAAMTADQKVAAREAAMKEDGQILRNALKVGKEEQIKISTKVLQNMVNFPALFADGATNAKSTADPIIWKQFDDFTGLFKQGQATAADMLAAANTGDSAKFQAAFKTIAGLCNDCHKTYRMD
ncbi:MAG: cytochrome c [Devosia sp.]|jgi:cytochrome c556